MYDIISACRRYHRYDIRANKWSSTPGTDMIEEVSAGAAVFFEGNIYVIGGSISYYYHHHRTVEIVVNHSGTDNSQMVHSSVESLSIDAMNNGWNYKHQAST